MSRITGCAGICLLASALAPAPASAAPAQPTDGPGAKRRIATSVSLAAEEPALAAPPAPGQFGLSGPRSGRALELFVRPAWNGVWVNQVATGSISLGPDSFLGSEDASLSSSSFGGGAGMRAVSGRFALEAVWHRLRTRDLIPFGDPREGFFEEFGDEEAPFYSDPDEKARADLYVAQLIFREPFGSGAAGMFFGVGGGIARVEDPVTEAFGRGDFLGEVPPEFQDLIETDVTPDQSAPVFGGSFGVVFEIGRLFVRPRLDVLFGRELSVGYRLRLGVGAFGEDELMPEGEALTLEVHNSMTPRFLLFSVDIGLTTG